MTEAPVTDAHRKMAQELVAEFAAYIAQALATAEAEGLELAAKEADSFGEYDDTGHAIATAIRALAKEG